ncbi:MAG: hypothetical protein ACOVMQ_11120 [Cyclobacteriaceae bacterium]|jgi:H2-forming N5,N10-methylenetetrahydromethanopterin dehydrogenase-like enzyme
MIFESLQEKKNQIIDSLQHINDEALILAIQNMITFSRQKDEEYLGESIEAYNEAIAKADAEIEQGQFVAHEEAMKKIQAWREHEK